MTHVAEWSRNEYEIPDVIDFDDYVASARQFAQERLASPPPGRLHIFPWSDGGKMRDLSVFECGDLVDYSSAAACVAATTDRLLSRQHVFSARLAHGPPRWTMHSHKKWYPRFRSSAIALLRSGACSAMRAEDIEKFFPSIQIEILLNFLAKHRCDRNAIESIARMLRFWQHDCGLAGLPIGPDASRLLGNAILLPMDRAIASTGIQHRRWMDDTVFPASELSRAIEAVEAGGEALTRLRLRFSPAKSRSFDNTREAIAFLENDLIASLASHRNHPHFLGAAESAWSEFAAGATGYKLQDFRFLLRNLQQLGSRVAVLDLVSDRDLANIDARVAGDYLAGAHLQEREIDDALAQVAAPADDNFDGLSLHMLRLFSQRHVRSLGSAEGSLFKSIAFNPNRHPALRCWALQAWAWTDDWTARSLTEAADAEAEPMVQRAALISMRGRPSMLRDEFLSHIVAKQPRLQYTARWVAQAA